jgi:hypothetical protein
MTSETIRLYHPTARSGFFTFAHNRRPYRVPLVCPICRVGHAVKTYHVLVDHDGFAMVSKRVWAMMRRHGTAGFRIANEVVVKPPMQLIGGAPVSLSVTALEE